MGQHIESIIRIDQLHPGYVLNQPIPGYPGLTQGRVLTPQDITALKNIPGLEEISVFVIDKTQSLEKRLAQSKPPSPENEQIHSVTTTVLHPRLDLQTQKNALFDAQANALLKQNLEQRKTTLRGINYEEELEKYRQKHLEKFSHELKYVQAQTRQASLQAIEHYARTKADFDRIRQLEGLGQGEMNQIMDRYLVYIDLFIRAVLTDKKIYTTYVESIVLDMIEDIGYRLARSLLAVNIQQQDKWRYMILHTMQVLITSLVTAIELTNIINEKAQSLTGEDINTFLSISKKTFTIEELVNLGIAAILHDIDIIKSFPELSAEHSFSLREEARIDLHPSNGFHIAQSLNLDFDVQRSLFQHHERFDGSGFPNGAPPRLFTKYTPILMFAEHYVEQSTHNPFVDESMVPRKVIINLLSHQRQKFDGDVIYAYLRAASLFPVGSWIKLSNGNTAVVSEVNHHKLDLPVVIEVFNEHMSPLECHSLDLSQSDITIVHPVSLHTIQQLDKSSLENLLHSFSAK